MDEFDPQEAKAYVALRRLVEEATAAERKRILEALDRLPLHDAIVCGGVAGHYFEPSMVRWGDVVTIVRNDR